MKTSYRTSIFASTLLVMCVTDVNAKAPCNTKIKLDHPALQLIDGTRLMNTQDMLNLINSLNELLETKKLVEYKDHFYNVEELAEKEQKESLQGPAMQTALLNAIKHFRDISADYLAKARGNKASMGIIIKLWANQRGITKSILLDWSKQSEGQEHEEFKKLVKNFRIFREFLEHLSCFLKCMTVSCPKSWQEYQKSK